MGVRHKEIGRKNWSHLPKASPGQDYPIDISYTYSTWFFIVTGLYYHFPRKLFWGTECQTRIKYFSAFSQLLSYAVNTINSSLQIRTLKLSEPRITTS